MRNFATLGPPLIYTGPPGSQSMGEDSGKPIWGQGLGLVTPFLLSPGTRGRAAANAFMRGLGLLT